MIRPPAASMRARGTWISSGSTPAARPSVRTNSFWVTGGPARLNAAPPRSPDAARREASATSAACTHCIVRSPSSGTMMGRPAISRSKKKDSRGKGLCGP